MSDEFDAEEGGEGIKNLRKEFESLKKSLAEKDAQLAGYQAKERTATVASVLKAKGLDEDLANAYSGDDVSEDAVSKWVEAERARAAKFLGQAPQSAPQSVPDANAAAAARINNLSQNANAVSVESINGKAVGDPAQILQLISGPNRLSDEQLVELGIFPKHDPYRPTRKG